MASAAKQIKSKLNPVAASGLRTASDTISLVAGNSATNTTAGDQRIRLQTGLGSGSPLPPGMGQAILIRAKYRELGGENGFLGSAISEVEVCADGKGYRRRYQGGAIYVAPGIGVHEVHGAILDRWMLLGAETGFLGYPITDETGAPDGVGRFNHFQNGSIYWTPASGAHEMHGAIRDKWTALGGVGSVVGYPLTDETGTPDGIGRFNHFQSGSIYWTPNLGAHEVHGSIRDQWSSIGWESSYLGYPTSDEHDVQLAGLGAGRESTFENGVITWTPGTGALTTPASVHLSSQLTSDLPIGGWADVTFNARGDVTFSGHLHNSGFDNIDYTLAVVIVSPTGASIGFERQGHTEGTSAALPFGSPNRNDDFVTPQGLNNQQVAAAWSQLRNGSLFWHLQSTDTLAQGVGRILSDLAQEALNELGSAAKQYLTEFFV
jgi:LGFP repeat